MLELSLQGMLIPAKNVIFSESLHIYMNLFEKEFRVLGKILSGVSIKFKNHFNRDFYF